MTNKPSWTNAPEWAKWLAKDSDCQWIWYEQEPKIKHFVSNKKVGIWVRVSGEFELAQKAGTQTYDPNWHSSLEERPRVIAIEELKKLTEQNDEFKSQELVFEYGYPEESGRKLKVFKSGDKFNLELGNEGDKFNLELGNEGDHIIKADGFDSENEAIELGMVLQQAL